MHVIGKNSRYLRLPWVLTTGMAIALVPAVRAFGLTATSTTLAAQSSTQACPTSGLTTTLTSLTIAVTGSGGVPSGTVNIEDEASGSPVVIGSATLNTSGQASVSFYLGNGSHTLLAAYAGNSTYSTSTSLPASASISSQCTTPFAVSLSNISPSSSSSSAMTLPAGQSGTATVTVTPSQEFIASLNTSGAPAFITVACSGLPSLAYCTFTPENLEILPGQDAGVISSMVIQTQAQNVRTVPPAGRKGGPVVWAFLLPGMLALGGLGWGARKRRWLQRLSLVALVGLVTALGTTGCNPLYYYYNHGPGLPPGTPTGTFNVTISGQSSNGVTAITNSTTMVLTVQ